MSPVLVKVKRNKKDAKLIFNVPSLALLLLLIGLTGMILKLVNSTANYVLGIIGFFCSVFTVICCCYCLYKIAISKCCYCGKKLEKRTEKAVNFLLIPPWKKKKIEFICKGCKENKT